MPGPFLFAFLSCVLRVPLGLTGQESKETSHLESPTFIWKESVSATCWRP
jgi:hypothetical protein